MGSDDMRNIGQHDTGLSAEMYGRKCKAERNGECSGDLPQAAPKLQT